tara:strand:- start:266 stop:511 length:246 start_codon:yes stop_codon:yes gene_type:complete
LVRRKIHLFNAGGQIVILNKEIITKINSIDRNLLIIMSKNKRKDRHLLESLLQDLAFIIGKLSNIYEVLLKTVPHETENRS